MPYLDTTPRFARVTYRDANGKVARWIGMVTLVDGKVRSQRRDDVKGGISLNLFFADLSDVIKVERQNPVYETWEVA